MIRRTAAKLILSLPVAAPALAGDDAEEKKADEKPPMATTGDKPTPQAECIAAQEAALSDAERATLKKSITGFDKAVQMVRDFRVPADIPPAVRFAALKSPRKA
jgi:hypothetical protein